MAEGLRGGDLIDTRRQVVEGRLICRTGIHKYPLVINSIEYRGGIDDMWIGENGEIPAADQAVA
jgi:hypothetical protein